MGGQTIVQCMQAQVLVNYLSKDLRSAHWIPTFRVVVLVIHRKTENLVCQRRDLDADHLL